MNYGGSYGVIKAYLAASHWLHDGKVFKPSYFTTDEITPGSFRVSSVIIENNSGYPAPASGLCKFDQELKAWIVQFPEADPIEVIERDSEWTAVGFAPNNDHVDDVAGDLLDGVDI